MQASKKMVSLIISTNFLLLPLVYSSHDHYPTKVATSHKLSNKSNIEELSPRLLFEITLHGFLLWASMGFLMPVGILIMRLSSREKCGRRLKILFYLHVILQVVSVVLVTAAAIMSVKNFENNFNNNHRKMGVALYGIIWIQALIGFRRPRRGIKGRSKWFFMHWVVGTGVTILGIINIYTGLEAYHEKTSRSVKIWSLLFTAEVCLITFLYLFQDKWKHMQNEGLQAHDQPAILPRTDNQVNNTRGDQTPRKLSQFLVIN